jgi:hypothetical protein
VLTRPDPKVAKAARDDPGRRCGIRCGMRNQVAHRGGQEPSPLSRPLGETPLKTATSSYSLRGRMLYLLPRCKAMKT